jgi:molybdopterin synthase catalytic subunit
MLTIRVQTGDFDLAAEMVALTAGRSGIGGIGCFVGVVRDNAAHPLAALSLEHYPGMTEQAMTAIAAEAMKRWDLASCTLLHRVGRLPVGANIVLVLAAAAHRRAALDAAGFLIDWLKTKAPFWKQELFADGTSRWIEARADDDKAASSWQ